MEEKSGRPFRPAWWLPGPHAQTIAGRYLRRPRSIAFRRERIDTPDGDFVDLDFPETGLSGGPVVLLLHGLEGSARRGYAIETYLALARLGVRSVGLNFRSCSGELNRTARFYHSGDTADIRLVAGILSTRFPGVPLGAIGFSLGGNALLKFLGEERGASPFSAAVAVSVPYDLGAGADALDTTIMGRIYTGVFVRSLTAKAMAKGDLLDGLCDRARFRAARSFRAFDDAATAPLHGFSSAQDYYDRSSSSGYIGHIRTPTLLIHSLDDPFLPAASFPAAAASSNPCISTLVTASGGHVGFIEGPPWRPGFWAEGRAAAFLAQKLHARNGGEAR
ncbi:MAG TPA: alpha/beta fold hydrolase [Longimicrobiales bacterium]